MAKMSCFFLKKIKKKCCEKWTIYFSFIRRFKQFSGIFVQIHLSTDFDILLIANDIGVKGKYISCLFHYICLALILLNYRRLFWIIFVIISLYFCGSSIHDILSNWNENPVTMSMTEAPTPISDIPFPTVTVCASNKIHKFKFKT